MMKIGIPFSAAIVHSIFDDIVFLNKSGMNPLEERWSLTGARGHAVGGESCPRTGSTMGDFGRKKGEKKPLGLSKSGYHLCTEFWWESIGQFGYFPARPQHGYFY